MIDFACKRFKIEDVIKCSLSLTKNECFLVKFFLDNSDDWFSAIDLKENNGLHLSSIQRSLKRLYEKKIIIRKQENLDLGGYVFYYKIRDKKELRDLILSIIKKWNYKLELELNKW
jgi:predicted transcriptional regulator